MTFEFRAIACQTCGHTVEAHSASGCCEIVVTLGNYRCRCVHSAGDLRARLHVEPRFFEVQTEPGRT